MRSSQSVEGSCLVRARYNRYACPAQKLEALPDPRSPQGRVYPLPCLIAIAIAIAIALCAFTAAGNDRLTAVGQWIRRASQQDLARLRAPWGPDGRPVPGTG